MDREDNDVDYLARLPPPPPPRSDVDIDEEYDSDEFEDNDDDEEDYNDRSLDHRLGYFQYQHNDGNDVSRNDNKNNDNHFNYVDDKAKSTSAPSSFDKEINDKENKKLVAAAVNDEDDDEKNNSMLFFGEDTMHVLMDAELRLKSIPPTPSTSSSLSYTPRSNIGFGAVTNATETTRGYSSGERRTIPNNVNEDSKGDDDEDGISTGTGVASLLRGPIMAANSAISSGAKDTMYHHDIGRKISDDFAISTRVWQDNGAEKNVTIQTQQDMIGANLTPSMFRKQFFPDETPTPSQVRNQFADHLVVSSALTKKTPGSTSSMSSFSRQFGCVGNSGGLHRKYTMHQQKQQVTNTPSMERSHFLPSPQDSVSTMGQLSPSDGYNGVANGPTAGTGDTLINQHPLQHSSGGGEISNDKKITNINPAFDGMIALGEQQMRLNTTSLNMNNRSDAKNPQVTVTKKPFLRKGTRREPSALHTRINTSNSIDVGLTPSTARLQQQCISPHSSALPQKLTDCPVNSNKQQKAKTYGESDIIESQSARKERLARLEKMQEDLIHDLERRLARKEEARHDRRRVKTSAKKKVTSTPDTAATMTCATPSQMRSPPAMTVGIPSLSASHQGSSATRTEQMKNSCADMTHSKPKTVEKPPAANSITTRHQNEDIITPSQARRTPSPSADSIVEKYDAKRNAELIEEEKNASDRDSLGDTRGFRNREKVNIKSKQQQVRSNSMPRPRSTVRSGNHPRSTAPRDVDEKRAFEEWKKKEAEQWALIKNMRKRQEAALREAEGERERAKAWAAAEKESVQKWVTEQRSVIEKYRHKAANAALIASKESMKGKTEDRNLEEQNDVKAELEKLRSEVKCQKEKEKAEIKKLKEVIREQEKTIDTLKRSKEGEGGDHVAKITKNSGSHGPRPVLADSSSKLNTKQQQPSRSKAQKKVVVNNSIKSRKGGVLVDITEDKLRDIDTDSSPPEEAEPSELWLQRHLMKLSDANNRLGVRLTEGEQHCGASSTGDMYQFENDDNKIRKPYNAADYSGKSDDLPNQVTNTFNPTVPSFVTAPSSSHQTNFKEQSRTKSQIISYKNGTQKEVLPDGTITISFANGDRKRTYVNEKEGIIVYYYASTKTTQVTHQDGMQTYHFPNGQIENHYTDGRKEITFPDSSTRIVHTDGSTDTVFADGVRVMDYPDGRQVVVQP